MASPRFRVPALVGGVLLALVGCAGPAAQDPTPSAPAGPSSSAALPPPVPLAERCAGAIPAGAEQRTLTASDGTVLNSAWLGSGGTVAVLLHQTDGDGLCGFLFYADYLAQQGLKVALLDVCGYGQSSCLGSPLADDPVAQVKVITDAARADSAQRVVLVGASMGGSTAVSAAATVKADAIVDLSGPAVFEGSDVAADAKHVTMPALFAFAHSDESDLVAVKAQLSKMPSKQKTFLTYDTGHGYDLLRDLSSLEFTPLAARVSQFAQGQS